VPVANAYGFGFEDESYIEFGVMKGKLDTKADYEFSFYTMEEEGLLMSGFMKSPYDYEAIYLAGGKAHYIFNAGAGSLTLSSKSTVNDGKWHTIKATRSKRAGTLYVDGDIAAVGESKPGASAVNNINKVYFGGLPSTSLVIPKTPKTSQIPLKGGMKDFKLFNEALVTPAASVGTSPAYNGLPYVNAVSFGANGGFAQKFKQLKIGPNFKISFDVRAANKAGSLFYVYGGGDHLSVTVEENGSIKVTCNNGGGLFSVAYKPEPSVCNGDIYSVLVEKKMKTLKLTVNGAVTEETTTKKSTSADTNSPAYFGGLPDNLRSNWSKISDSKEYKPFEGCISKVEINDKAVDFTSDVIKNGAVMTGCPE